MLDPAPTAPRGLAEGPGENRNVRRAAEVPMKRLVMTLILWTVIAATMVGAATTETPATTETSEPVLTVEQPRIDLGEIKAGSDAVATFVFHNSGPNDVKIIRAKPS